MKEYGQFCPMARASEIFAERWTPLIVRNMLAGCHTFSQILEGAPGLSKTLLTERLRVLERNGIVERRPSSSARGHTYWLTPVGEDLAPVCRALGEWGSRYLELDPVRQDPYLVLWDMAHVVDRDALPENRVVIRFDVPDRRPHDRYWLLLESAGTELCDKFPGYPEDLVVIADSRSLAEWHAGRLPLGRALRDHVIRVEGSSSLVRRFITCWQGVSPFAYVHLDGAGVATPEATAG